MKTISDPPSMKSAGEIIDTQTSKEISTSKDKLISRTNTNKSMFISSGLHSPEFKKTGEKRDLQ